MDKIYEQKGLMLRQAFAELPLDVSLNMKNLSNFLNTTPEAIFCYAITKGMVQAWDLIAGDREEAKEPIEIEAKVTGCVSERERSILLLRFPFQAKVGQKEYEAIGNVYAPILTKEKQDDFKGKEVTITIALKGGQE